MNFLKSVRCDNDCLGYTAGSHLKILNCSDLAGNAGMNRNADETAGLSYHLTDLNKIANLDTRNAGRADVHTHRNDDLVGSRNALRHTLCGILVMRHMSTTQSFNRH